MVQLRALWRETVCSHAADVCPVYNVRPHNGGTLESLRRNMCKGPTVSKAPHMVSWPSILTPV